MKGITLYIRYNNFEEYTYQIVFSKKKFDRISYDNYDDKWDVKTKPYQLHPRNILTAIESPMLGEPEKDIRILIGVLIELL